MERNAAARKIQNIFRRRRVFTNKLEGVKLSKVVLTTQIVHYDMRPNTDTIFDKAPKGFDEVRGYIKSFRKPVVRYVPGHGWIGDETGVTFFTAKKGKQSVKIDPSGIDILGAGNPEVVLLALARNGWVSKTNVHQKPKYKKIDGKFNVNKDFDLVGLRDEFKRCLPDSMVKEIPPYEPTLFPAMVLKLAKPAWTYQFFKNGTVLFSGIKTPDDKDKPKELFKEFFTKYNVTTVFAFSGMNLKVKMPEKKPVTPAVDTHKLAGTWNSLKDPPQGYYVRPGTDGKPRFYPWYLFETRRGGEGNNKHVEIIPIRPLNLRLVRPKVVQAYKNAGKNVPRSTLNIFEKAGVPLVNKEASKYKGHSERRAPSWNAIKPGFYVRPGAGQQPYWFKVPTGIASGRKTVIKTYTQAGRNIPAEVRRIFGISVNTKTEGSRNHRVTMGLNGILRINDRQATRLTRTELVSVARNMGIAQVDEKTKPEVVIQYIARKVGIKKPNRNYDVVVNGTFYKILSPIKNMSEQRVEKTSKNGVRTTRNWATLSSEEQNKIAEEFLPTNTFDEYKKLGKSNKFLLLRMTKASNANFASELENFMKEP